MYYWDQPGQDELNGAERPRRPAHGAHPGAAGATGPAAQAVQVALDRRDNGGDSSVRRDQ
jgi:hypothetical protein